MSQDQHAECAYVLITAAHNEEAYIERLISSVVSQTLRPLKWVIVSDGSVDRTEDIVARHAAVFPFIQLLRLTEVHSREFASKSHALNAAAKWLKPYQYNFIGHLDADVSFESGYMQELLRKFEVDPSLGISGGLIYEEHNGRFQPRRANSVRSVAGAVQMFRRECYESLGAFLPMRCGGEDWHAEITARMNGYRVMAFPELRVYHHRPAGGAGGVVKNWYRQGVMDYSVGCDPVFEIVRMIGRLRARPLVLGAAVRFCAFAVSYLRSERRPVSPEFVKFLRTEQRNRLWPFRSKQRPHSAAV